LWRQTPPSIETTTPTEDLTKYAHVKLVRLYIDGYLCERCGDELKRALVSEEGIQDIVSVTEKKMIELTAKTGAFLDLYDIKVSSFSAKTPILAIKGFVPL
jgi:hypothetical protein